MKVAVYSVVAAVVGVKFHRGLYDQIAVKKTRMYPFFVGRIDRESGI